MKAGGGPALRHAERAGRNDAKLLIKNGVAVRGRGRQHASTIEAAKAFEAAGVLYAPARPNAGGVATSGLE